MMSLAPASPKKVNELTILKSLAFLAVVFQSSLINTLKLGDIPVEQSVMIGMLFNFVKFSAPVFIFVVGFHLIHHHRTPVKYGTYIRTKWTELMVPYLIWTIVYMITITHSAQLSVKEIATLLFTGSAAPHLWYVVMVFQFHLLFPFLFLFFQWVSGKLHSRTFVTTLITISAFLYLSLVWASSHFIFNGQLLTETTWLKYTDRSFVSYFFYFFLGGVAALTLTSWRRFVSRYISVSSFLFIGLFIIVGYELITFKGISHIDLNASTYLKPSMFLYICSEIILLYGLSMAIVQTRSYLNIILTFIGKYTYGSYLAHLFFLQMIIQWSHLSSWHGHYLFISIGLFIITTVVSVGFSYLMSFIPSIISLLKVKRKTEPVRELQPQIIVSKRS